MPSLFDILNKPETAKIKKCSKGTKRNNLGICEKIIKSINLSDI